MTTSQVRQNYLDFFVARGHKIIPAAPLVPENDPTTLFTSSGMQQLVSYLRGEPHPLGKRLVDSQVSLRLQDIEEVGDTSHTTFFEMLGNWSLGDYFKKEQLFWLLEFLTKELELPKEKLFVSVFEGNENVVQDKESAEIWKSLGITEKRIFYYGEEKNWWSRSGTPEEMPIGEIGGPDSEVFFDFGENLKLHENSVYKNKKCHPNCQCGRFLEIGNSVFIQYEKKEKGMLAEIPQKNVDFGGGLERLTATTNDDPDIFKIDLFAPMIRIIEAEFGKSYHDSQHQKSMRIIADHLRAAVFLIAQGIEPSNKTQGYVLRRLLRRSAVKMHQLGRGLTPISGFAAITDEILRTYDGVYFDQSKVRNLTARVVKEEMKRFENSLDRGLKELEKLNGEQLDTLNAFNLYQSYGFPFEVAKELIEQRGGRVSEKEFDEIYRSHQELSRKTTTKLFKGGLVDHSEEVTKLHTATHLLQAALRQVLGKHVQQKGSNITTERLRFDFLHPRKLTGEERRKLKELVNQKIRENLPVKMEIMNLKVAQKSGALGFFAERYGDKVKVYTMGSFSKEICGGPHVDFTGRLGRFKIIKEEAAGAGVRRIYATTIS